MLTGSQMCALLVRTMTPLRSTDPRRWTLTVRTVIQMANQIPTATCWTRRMKRARARGGAGVAPAVTCAPAPSAS